MHPLQNSCAQSRFVVWQITFYEDEGFIDTYYLYEYNPIFISTKLEACIFWSDRTLRLIVHLAD